VCRGAGWGAGWRLGGAAVLTFAEHLRRAQTREALRDLARELHVARDYVAAATADRAREGDEEAMVELTEWLINNEQGTTP